MAVHNFIKKATCKDNKVEGEFLSKLYKYFREKFLVCKNESRWSTMESSQNPAYDYFEMFYLEQDFNISPSSLTDFVGKFLQNCSLLSNVS